MSYECANVGREHEENMLIGSQVTWLAYWEQIPYESFIKKMRGRIAGELHGDGRIYALGDSRCPL